MLKVLIDQEVCMGCASCTATCMKVFELDDSATNAQITPRYRESSKNTGRIPKDIECVRIAARKCPVGAIEIFE